MKISTALPPKASLHWLIVHCTAEPSSVASPCHDRTPTCSRNFFKFLKMKSILKNLFIYFFLSRQWNIMSRLEHPVLIIHMWNISKTQLRHILLWTNFSWRINDWKLKYIRDSGQSYDSSSVRLQQGWAGMKHLHQRWRLSLTYLTPCRNVGVCAECTALKFFWGGRVCGSFSSAFPDLDV